MKKYIAMATVLLSLPLSAQAQEQQVYNPYGGSNLYPTYEVAKQQTSSSQVSAQHPNAYMVYPGREQYGERFGSIPRHPGDYRDAVDRGTWSAGGGGQRSFDIR